MTPNIWSFKGEPDSLVTSVRLEEGPGHDRVTVWNRHGQAGEVVLMRGDGLEFVRRLLPKAMRGTRGRGDET